MLVFFFSFILYLYTLFPGVAQYRDTGEMVSVAHTLGVAHSPGYPLYTLIGKAFLILMPWGNEGYKLNVLSALAGAGAVWLMYRLFLACSVPKAGAFLLSLLLGTSYLQWYLSLVSEMYTLGTLFAALLMFLMLRPSPDEVSGMRKYMLFAFLFGLGLGNRMDLLLIGAGLSWIYFKDKTVPLKSSLPLLALMFILGFSVFLYLPVRSGQAPWIDWNHPADLSRFWGSLTRKTHGGTLDLVSAPYASGENFAATMRFYMEHLFGSFAYLGIPLGLAGIYSLLKRSRVTGIATLLAWFIIGPIFIYKANMPPNPHALAILEAHFLLPNLIYAFWMAEGFSFVFKRGAAARYSGIGLCTVMLGVNLIHHYPQLQKRDSYFLYDYTNNVMKSLPEKAVVVLKKDVQIFSMWAAQFAGEKRRDLAVVAQGLAGSFWYQRSFNELHPNLPLCQLSSPEGWGEFVQLNKAHNLYITGDTEYPSIKGFELEPDGLVYRIRDSALSPQGATLMEHFYTYRGDFLYTAYREFFTPSLIEDYANAYSKLGMHYLRQNNLNEARAYLLRALSMQPMMPPVYDYLGFSYFQEGDYATAADIYLKGIRQHFAMLKLAGQYNALPETLDGIQRTASDAYVSAGVCFQRLKRYDESLDCYSKAIETYPRNPKSYFNRSVIYWERGEWGNVIAELENALRIDPDYQEAAFYLMKARKMAESKKQ